MKVQWVQRPDENCSKTISRLLIRSKFTTEEMNFVHHLEKVIRKMRFKRIAENFISKQSQYQNPKALESKHRIFTKILKSGSPGNLGEFLIPILGDLSKSSSPRLAGTQDAKKPVLTGVYSQSYTQMTMANQLKCQCDHMDHCSIFEQFGTNQNLLYGKKLPEQVGSKFYTY